MQQPEPATARQTKRALPRTRLSFPASREMTKKVGEVARERSDGAFGLEVGKSSVLKRNQDRRQDEDVGPSLMASEEGQAGDKPDYENDQ